MWGYNPQKFSARFAGSHICTPLLKLWRRPWVQVGHCDVLIYDVCAWVVTGALRVPQSTAVWRRCRQVQMWSDGEETGAHSCRVGQGDQTVVGVTETTLHITCQQLIDSYRVMSTTTLVFSV